MTNLVLLAGGVIPTNTVAFKAYALTALLSQANYLATEWQLSTGRPITEEQIAKVVANPMTNGLSGGIFFGQNYGLSVCDGSFSLFRDYGHYSHSFVGRDDKMEALAGQTNLLTADGTLALAREKLHRIGIDELKLGLANPATLDQWKYDSNGVVYPLPLYVVRWQTTTGGYFVVDMEISGITSNVAELHHTIPLDLLPPALRVPMPTNYLQMLGLPTNVNFLPHDHERRERLLRELQTNPPAVK